MASYISAMGTCKIDLQTGLGPGIENPRNKKPGFISRGIATIEE
jgi:hypothetical protein